MRRIPWTTLALVLLVGEGCKTPGRAEAPQPALAPGRIETTDAIEANFHKLLEHFGGDSGDCFFPKPADPIQIG